jgi:hypothetical protein
MRVHPSFLEFQEFIRRWLPANRSAVQLDGNHCSHKNPATTDEVKLSDVPGLTHVVIGFHGDTRRDALERVAQGKIEDFILLGPKPGATNWRFHHAAIPHNLAELESAGGMFAYVKK